MKPGIVLLVVWMVLAVDAYAAEVSMKAWVIPEFHTFNSDSPFALGASQAGFGKDRSREVIELRATSWDVNLVATAQTTAQEQSAPEHKLIINELYYDFSLFGERFSLGKKLLSWDVGFGFRPLDVIQQENRRTVITTTLEGVPYLAWDKFQGNSAWMLVYANPGNGKMETAKNDESLAIKYYLRDGNTDWHAIVRLSERNHVEGGGAFSDVPVECFEWHGSLLYQQQFEKPYNSLISAAGTPISTNNPMMQQSKHHGVKSLVGFTLTGQSGFSLLGEAWYDAGAYTASEWRGVKKLAERQMASLGHGVPVSAVSSNIAYSTRYFDRPNLLRENLLLRLSHRQEGESWEPSLDILCTPADGGVVVTAVIGYTGNHFRIDAGIRQYGGARNSAYDMLPEERIIYVAVQGFW